MLRLSTLWLAALLVLCLGSGMARALDCGDPAVTSVTPQAAWVSFETEFTIKGCWDVAGLTVNTGKVACVVSEVTNIQLKCKVPAGSESLGTVKVTVEYTDPEDPEQKTSASLDGVLQLLLPRVYSVTPNSAPGNQGANVALYGENLSPGALQPLGLRLGDAVKSITVGSTPTHLFFGLVAQSVAEATRYPIELFDTGSGATVLSIADAFTLDVDSTAPSLFAVSPAYDFAFPLETRTVDIFGYGLTKDTTVTLNGVPCTNPSMVIEGRLLSCLVGACENEACLGVGQAVVTVPDAAPVALPWRYIPEPTKISILPTNAPPANLASPLRVTGLVLPSDADFTLHIGNFRIQPSNNWGAGTVLFTSPICLNEDDACYGVTAALEVRDARGVLLRSFPDAYTFAANVQAPVIQRIVPYGDHLEIGQTALLGIEGFGFTSFAITKAVLVGAGLDDSDVAATLAVVSDSYVRVTPKCGNVHAETCKVGAFPIRVSNADDTITADTPTTVKFVLNTSPGEQLTLKLKPEPKMTPEDIAAKLGALIGAQAGSVAVQSWDAKKLILVLWLFPRALNASPTPATLATTAIAQLADPASDLFKALPDFDSTVAPTQEPFQRCDNSEYKLNCEAPPGPKPPKSGKSKTWVYIAIGGGVAAIVIGTVIAVIIRRRRRPLASHVQGLLDDHALTVDAVY